MTRASEFCYIAERAVDGAMLMAVQMTPELPALWTKKPELALRINDDGRLWFGRRMGAAIGFRKVLAG